jgi:DNA-binding response OmpR family regulator
MLQELRPALILVVEDVHEISDGIERLLKTDGYRVALARDELHAIESVQLTRPDLILMGWTGLSAEVLATVCHIRERAAVADQIPLIFWVEDLDEGEEIALEENVYLTRPDSFDQLRGLLARLLDERSNVALSSPQNEFMTTISTCRTPFMIRFMDTKPRVLLELTNTTEMTLKSIEILTVFLKDEGPAAGSSRAHIRFDPINSVQPKGKAVISHRTWINGTPASEAQDQIGRLQVVAGAVKPYVLDISWEDVDGKIQFQRIPVGH